MAPEYFSGLTEHSIMANGEITRCTEKESFDGPMAEFIMENTLMIRNMGREYTRGRTDECTKVNFIMVNSMAKASTVKIMARKFMASGKRQKDQDILELTRIHGSRIAIVCRRRR